MVMGGLSLVVARAERRDKESQARDDDGEDRDPCDYGAVAE